MKEFTYERATSTQEAAAKARETPGAKFIAGGTNLLDLMKLEIETPRHLIDVNGLGLDKIENGQDGGLRIGALVRNTTLAADMRVRKDYGVLSRALLAGASGQLRNKATTAGNLLQRTRCPYFYDTNQPCNKRSPGSGCAAIEGFSRQLAVIGTSESCIATNPSDMAVAMRALDAEVGDRRRHGSNAQNPDRRFHRLPGNTPHIETTSAAGELSPPWRCRDPIGVLETFQKVRDRASYAFAACLCGGRRTAGPGPDRWPSAAWPTSRGGSKKPKPICQRARSRSPRGCSRMRSRPTTTPSRYRLVERTVAAALNDARQR